MPPAPAVCAPPARPCAAQACAPPARRPAREAMILPGDILDEARSQVLRDGVGLDPGQVASCLRLPGDRLGDALELAHEVRMRWCGPEVEVEGIVSVKTGGCPEDCHFCSQSGQFSSPVRPAWLDVARPGGAPKATAATGATEVCSVAAVPGPRRE